MQYIFPSAYSILFAVADFLPLCVFDLRKWPPLKAATATNTLPTVKIFSDFVVFFIANKKLPLIIKHLQENFEIQG